LDHANNSPAIALSDARSVAKFTSVGRVAYSDPFCASSMRLNGGTDPDALPKLTNVPRGDRQSSDAGNVSLPTPS
jgi:hypothetical protein